MREIGEIGEQTTFCLALLSGYLTILITNFFGFSVVNVQLLFFLFPAMAIVALGEGGWVVWPGLNKAVIWLKNRGKLSTFGIGLTAATLLWQIGIRWVADTHYAKALQLFGQSSIQSAFLEARQALAMTPNEPVFADELAQTSGALAIAATQQSESTIAGQLAAIAVSASDQAIATSPKNLQFWTARTRILYSLANVNESGNFADYLNQALSAAIRTTQLAPTHPRMFYQLALIQLKIGQLTEAQQSLEKAINLKPDYKDPRYALALYLAGEKNFAGALDQANYILTKIDTKDETVRSMAATWSANISGNH
jgi:putative inorganic carbon (HCO3(-)) transporter